ncbi:MAG: DUF362 domain-containing protein [Thermodesulfobacteriota bacterium]
MRPKVSLQKCKDYDRNRVYASVKSSIDLLGGMGRFVKNGENILIKPNLLFGKPPEMATTTHPSVVEAIIRLVREEGGAPVVGDSPGVGSAVKVASKAGIKTVCDRLGVNLIDFKESVRVENPDGKTFKNFVIAKEVLEADAIINLPKLKTHAQMFMTLGVKNLFGCIIGRRKAQWHSAAGRDRDAFARMLIDLYRLIHPRLTIMDGIISMEGNGPGSGDPRWLGLLFAASDCIAMDRVITEVVGAKRDDLFTTKVAGEDSLGETSLNSIDVLGEKITDVRVRDFRFPPLIRVDGFASIPSFIQDYLRDSFAPKPVINNKHCTLCKRCVNICPPNCITCKKDAIIEINYDSCIRCFCCQEICPEGAIAARVGWLGRLMIQK